MIREKIKADARQWVVKLSDDHSPQTRAEFERWLERDPSHAAAYRDSSRVWTAVSEMQHLLPLVLPAASMSRSRRFGQSVVEGMESVVDLFRRPRVAWGAVAAVTLAISFVVANSLGLLGDRAEVYATAVAEVRKITLPDGSTVTLDARSTIEPRFESTERRVLLREGAAIFDVAPDAQKPFIVLTEGVQVRALGTEFEVHRGANQVRVSVVEGLVEIVPSASNEAAGGVAQSNDFEATRIGAGEQITTSTRGIKKELRQVTSQEIVPWRSGMLRYTDADLAEVIADANRYYVGRIELADSQLGSLRLTTAFGTNQIDQFLDILPDVLPVHLTRAAPGRIVLSSAKESTDP